MFSGSWSLDDLYNPMGAVLLKVSAGQWSTYAARLADLEGARRAAVLTVELRSSRRGSRSACRTAGGGGTAQSLR
ncbi:hypothetical protein LP419_09175 [Massilia sp. H-1]|nr:hypothetical protein LP419_09175 [Massilia sp. H-1]